MRRHRSPGKRPARAKPPAQPDLTQVLGAFSDGMDFIDVAIRSLDADDGRGGVEIHVLEHGLTELRAAYNQLDAAISIQTLQTLSKGK